MWITHCAAWLCHARQMFLRDNYVHGDMHAGNLIFSMEDGRVTVIDAGLITSLQPDVANQVPCLAPPITDGVVVGG